jgi:hypothetical protein
MRSRNGFRTIASCALVACAAVGLAVPGGAEAKARTRFSLPVPNAGDVTLARILVLSTPAGRHGPRGVSLRGEGRLPPAGTQVAWAGTVTHYSRGRQLADVLVAVARPASAHGAGASRVKLHVVGRHMRPSLLRLAGGSNMRFFAPANATASCNSLGSVLPQASVQGRVLRGAWPGLRLRTFVERAFAWGCPDQGDGGDDAFDSRMSGAIGTGFVTFTTAQPDRGLICVYVHDAPGVSGQVTVEGAQTGTLTAAYSVPSSGITVVRLDTGSGGFRVSLTRGRPGAATRAWQLTALLLPPSTGPPVPAALAASVGGCP